MARSEKDEENSWKQSILSGLLAYLLGFLGVFSGPGIMVFVFSTFANPYHRNQLWMRDYSVLNKTFLVKYSKDTTDDIPFNLLFDLPISFFFAISVVYFPGMENKSRRKLLIMLLTLFGMVAMFIVRQNFLYSHTFTRISYMLPLIGTIIGFKIAQERSSISWLYYALKWQAVIILVTGSSLQAIWMVPGIFRSEEIKLLVSLFLLPILQELILSLGRVATYPLILDGVYTRSILDGVYTRRTIQWCYFRKGHAISLAFIFWVQLFWLIYTRMFMMTIRKYWPVSIFIGALQNFYFRHNFAFLDDSISRCFQRTGIKPSLSQVIPDPNEQVDNVKKERDKHLNLCNLYTYMNILMQSMSMFYVTFIVHYFYQNFDIPLETYSTEHLFEHYERSAQVRFATIIQVLLDLVSSVYHHRYYVRTDDGLLDAIPIICETVFLGVFHASGWFAWTLAFKIYFSAESLDDCLGQNICYCAASGSFREGSFRDSFCKYQYGDDLGFLLNQTHFDI